MSDVLQALGFALITVGMWIWLGDAAGLITGGIVLLIAGEAVDR
ncbi:MAG: hypothetical protein ACLGHX_00940 [Acidimicrobiia bacterium]